MLIHGNVIFLVPWLNTLEPSSTFIFLSHTIANLLANDFHFICRIYLEINE